MQFLIYFAMPMCRRQGVAVMRSLTLMVVLLVGSMRARCRPRSGHSRHPHKPCHRHRHRLSRLDAPAGTTNTCTGLLLLRLLAHI